MADRTKIKVAVAYCVHDDVSLFPASIRSFKDSGVQLIAFVGKRPWSGEAGDWERAAQIAGDAGGEVLLGDWEDENEHRRAALEHLRGGGYTHALIPDSDELVEPGLLSSLLSIAKEDLADVVRVEMDTYWKSPEYLIRPRERITPVLLVRLDRAEVRHLREYDGERVLHLGASYGVLHHLSYVGDDVRIRRKITSFSHKHEIGPQWWSKVWTGWEADRTMQTLHPTHPGAYGFAQRIPIPKILDEPDLRPFVEARKTKRAAVPANWPRISIIIPTCGLSPIFDRCLDALQAAGELLHEVIVVSDGPCPGLKVPKDDRFKTVNGLMTQQGLYAPGTAAASFIQQSLDMPVEEVARYCTPHEGPLLVEHSLRVLDFRLQLEKEARVSGVEIEEWLCEPECLHEFAYLPGRGAGWSSVVMKPDGFFRIGRCGAFFVEIDLGHVSLPRFEQKLKRFDSYRDSGAFTEAYDANEFSVLTVTVGERRLSHLAALPTGSFDHLVTSWRRLQSDGVFDCTWATCRVPEIRLVDLLNPVGLVNSR